MQHLRDDGPSPHHWNGAASGSGGGGGGDRGTAAATLPVTLLESMKQLDELLLPFRPFQVSLCWPQLLFLTSGATASSPPPPPSSSSAAAAAAGGPRPSSSFATTTTTTVLPSTEWASDYLIDSTTGLCSQQQCEQGVREAGEDPECFMMRHGKLVGKIYTYFHRYACRRRPKRSRRMSALITHISDTTNGSTPSTTPAKASAASHNSSNGSSRNGTGSDAPSTPTPNPSSALPSAHPLYGKDVAQTALVGEEAFLYQCALLCANYSVLAVGGKVDAPLEADALNEYLMNAFHLSPEQHAKYSKSIKDSHGNKRDAEILVRELARQLSYLESNSNPFYHPQAFANKNTYDLWRQQEQAKIRLLIECFWTGAIPVVHSGSVVTSASAPPSPAPSASGAAPSALHLTSPPASRTSGFQPAGGVSAAASPVASSTTSSSASAPSSSSHRVSVFHTLYVALLEKIVQYERYLARSRSAVASAKVSGNDASPSPDPRQSLLSHCGVRILTEFGLRYGVGELYRKIMHLNYLAKHFENTVSSILESNAVLQDILKLLPQHHSRVTITMSEHEVLRQTVSLLHAQVRNSLTRIKRLFPNNQPSGGVDALISLLSSLIQADRYVGGGKSMAAYNIDYVLACYLKESFATSYQRFLTIAADWALVDNVAPAPVNQSQQQKWSTVTCPFTASQLTLLVEELIDEVDYYRTYYEAPFKDHFNLIELAVEEYYNMICEDVHTLCSKYARTGFAIFEGEDIDASLIQLSYALNYLEANWAPYLQASREGKPTWKEDFIPISIKWMDLVAVSLMQFVELSYHLDEWESFYVDKEVFNALQLTNTSLEHAELGIMGQLDSSQISSASASASAVSEPKQQKTLFSSSPMASSAASSSSSYRFSGEWVDSEPVEIPNSSSLIDTIFAIAQPIRFVKSLQFLLEPSAGLGGSSVSTSVTDEVLLYSEKLIDMICSMLQQYASKSFLSELLDLPDSAIDPLLSSLLPGESDATPLTSSALDARNRGSSSQPSSAHGSFIGGPAPSVIGAGPYGGRLHSSSFTSKSGSFSFSVLTGSARNGLVSKQLCQNTRNLMEAVIQIKRGALPGSFGGPGGASGGSSGAGGGMGGASSSSGSNPNVVKGLDPARVRSLQMQQKRRQTTSHSVYYHSVHGRKIPVDPITEEICVRINNMEALIAIFPEFVSALCGGGFVNEQSPFDLTGPSPIPSRAATPMMASPAYVRSNSTLTQDSTTTTSMSQSAPRTVTNASLLKTLHFIKHVYLFQIEGVCARINAFVKPTLEMLLDLKLANYSTERRLEPIIAYLKSQLTVQSSVMYEASFRRVLLSVWDAVVNDLEDFILPSRRPREISAEQAKMLEEVIAILVTFFYVEGRGISLDTLYESVSFAVRMLDVHSLSTESLIEIWSRMRRSDTVRSGLDKFDQIVDGAVAAPPTASPGVVVMDSIPGVRTPEIHHAQHSHTPVASGRASAAIDPSSAVVIGGSGVPLSAIARLVQRTTPVKSGSSNRGSAASSQPSTPLLGASSGHFFHQGQQPEGDKPSNMFANPPLPTRSNMQRTGSGSLVHVSSAGLRKDADVFTLGATLYKEMHDPASGPLIRDRRPFLLKKYPQCFPGNEFCEFVVKRGHCRSTEEAVKLGQALLAHDIIVDVNQGGSTASTSSPSSSSSSSSSSMAGSSTLGSTSTPSMGSPVPGGSLFSLSSSSSYPSSRSQMVSLNSLVFKDDGGCLYRFSCDDEHGKRRLNWQLVRAWCLENDPFVSPDDVIQVLMCRKDDKDARNFLKAPRLSSSSSSSHSSTTNSGTVSPAPSASALHA